MKKKSVLTWGIIWSIICIFAWTLILVFLFLFPTHSEMMIQLLKHYPKEVLFTIVVMIMLSIVIPIWNMKVSNSKNNIRREDKFPNEFEKIYKNLYENYMDELEKIRKKLEKKRNIILSIFGIFILFALLTETYKKEIPYNFQMYMILAFLGFIFLTFINIKKSFDVQSKYEIDYKKNIVENFIKLTNNKLQYREIGEEIKVIQSEYQKCDFDKIKFNEFNADDYIEGYLNEETNVNIADINVRRTFEEKDKQDIDLFQGLFAFFQCNKSIEKSLIISSNGLTNNDINNWIEMDSAEFEEYFDIYSEDKVLAMRILTSDIMEFLIDFRKNNHYDIEIMLKNNMVYFRFFTGRMFEANLFKKAVDKEILYIDYCILKFIEEFNIKINSIYKEIGI